MNSGRTWKNRIFILIAIPLTGCLIVIAYWHGKPWLKFHQQNVVLYDCQLKSETIPVGAVEAGKIARMFVQVGDRLSPGDPIAELDSRELHARLAEAKEAVELAKLRLAAKSLALEKSLNTMDSMIESQKARTQVAAQKWSSTQVETKWLTDQMKVARKLFQRGSVSQLELQKVVRELKQYQAKSKIAASQQKVEQREFEILQAQRVEREAVSSELQVLEQEIALSRRLVETLKQKLEMRTVRAKASGVVTDIYRSAGSSIAVGDSILQMQGCHVWAEAWVDESQLTDMGPGLPVDVFLKAFPDETITGRISGYFAAPQALERSPQETENPILQANAKICIQISLPQNKYHLLPGLTGRVIVNRNDEQRYVFHKKMKQDNFLAHVVVEPASLERVLKTTREDGNVQ